MISALCLGACSVVAGMNDVPASPVLEDIIAAWKSRESETETAEIAWKTTRDSRSAKFGEGQEHNAGREWKHRLRFDRSRYRLDGERRLFNGDDGRILDPDNRTWSDLEFRFALQSGFEQTGTILEWRPITLILTRERDWPNGVAELDRLLAAAPLLAVRPLTNPLLPIDPTRLAVAPTPSSLAVRGWRVLEQYIDDSRTRQLWIDPKQGYRIQRVIETTADSARWQIDLEYSPDDPITPTKWTVLRIEGGSDETTQFATAERLAVRRNILLTEATFRFPEEDDSSELATSGSGPASSGFRREIQDIVNSPWLLAAIACLVIITPLSRYITKRNRCRPHEPKQTSP